MTAAELLDLYIQDEQAVDAMYLPCPEWLQVEEIASGVAE